MTTTMKAGFAMGVLALALMGFSHWLFLKASVAVFDEKALTRRFVSQLAAHRVQDAEVTGRARQFRRALKESLEHWHATHPQQIVLSREAAVIGGTDITDVVAAEVAGRMAKQTS